MGNWYCNLEKVSLSHLNACESGFSEKPLLREDIITFGTTISGIPLHEARAGEQHFVSKAILVNL